jgi:DNA polymerase-3 subunit gamma/tau
MGYQALYRKYRPLSFDDVVGQAHVTSTIAREVAEGRVAHAYLFAGPRGTGKTTTARILAKALNCENRGMDGSPDNTCASCVAITTGSSLDVLELDAASHNSVEDIRDIRISVTTVASSVGARRVFILDEAHMLSKAAGNALLKTLEEPPEHVHFVLATTEPYKLADTIRSRAQRFDFHPLPADVLAAHIGRIAEMEGYKADAPALIAVARHASGSARDALSLLEQVAALGSGLVNLGGVNRALGLADSEAFARLAAAVASADARAGLELVAELAAQGVDLRRFVSEAVGFFRGVFLAHYAPNLADVSDEPGEVLDLWRATAKRLAPAEVLRAVDLFGEALLRLRDGREERLMVELAVIKLTRPETAVDNDALLVRVDRLERRTPKAEAPQPQPAAATPPPPSSVQPPLSAPGEPGPSVEKVREAWPAIFGTLRDALGARRWALFREVTPGAVEGSRLILHVPHDFHLESLRKDPVVSKIVATRAGDVLGQPVDIEFRAAHPAEPAVEDIELEKDRLFEAPSDLSDPTKLLEAELGATLVEEVEASD